MNDITQEQAKQITCLESYKTVTGAKRFKRTKEEMTKGLTPLEALFERINDALGIGILPPIDKIVPVKDQSSRKSGITIQVRAAPKTDADYFEHVPGQPVEIVLDEHWYKWYDQLMSGPFEGDHNKLLAVILDRGIGEVLTKYLFPADVKNLEGVR